MVVSQEFAASPINLAVEDEPLETVIELVSRQLSTDYTRVGETYYLGDRSESDHSVYVARWPRYERDELQEMLNAAIGDEGSTTIGVDGVAVVLAPAPLVTRLQALHAELLLHDSVSWAVQLYVVRDSWERLRDVGVELTPAVEIAYTVAAASSSVSIDPTLSTDLAAGLAGVVKAAGNDAAARAEFAPLLVCSDGVQAKYQDGVSLLIPKRAANVERGTTVQQGFERVEVGLIVSAMVRERSSRQGLLTLEFELSAVDRFIDETPVVTQRVFSTSADVSDGGLYLLGEVSSFEDSDQRDVLFRIGKRDQDRRSAFQIWARVFRIGGLKNGLERTGSEIERTGSEKKTSTDPGSAPVDERALVTGDYGVRGPGHSSPSEWHTDLSDGRRLPDDHQPAASGSENVERESVIDGQNETRLQSVRQRETEPLPASARAYAPVSPGEASGQSGSAPRVRPLGRNNG